MKALLSQTMLLFALSATLLSFSSTPGGEGFEIYLNNKVVLQRYGNEINTVTTLQLSQATMDDKLSIRYHHCGRAGKNRLIVLKDEQNKILKEFRYPDVAAPASGMEIRLKEILNLKKSNILRLSYSSSELPNGKTLVTLNTKKATLINP